MLSRSPIRAYIPASDVSRARRFYEGTLGLRPKQEFADGVIYECGGAEAFLYPSDNAGTSKASQAYWEVEDVAAEVAELKARGVTFEEYDLPDEPMSNSIAVAGGAKTAWFKDTEGNILAVSQTLQAPVEERPMPRRTPHAQGFEVSVTVSDVHRSMRMYIDGLGFAVVETHEHEGTLMAVLLSAGPAKVLLSQDSFEKGRDRVKGLGVRFYLHTDQDLDELAERAKHEGLIVDRAVGPLPWGPMGFTVTDPDGYRLAISRAT